MTSETEARRSVAMTGAPLQPLDALDLGGLAGQRDLGAEAGKFLHMHEAVFEDRLGDVRDAGRARHQRHELRLQVGREAREGIGDDIDRLDAGAIAHDAHAVVRSA